MKNKEPTRRSSRIPKNNDEENLSYTGRKRKNSSPAVASPKIQKKTDKERKTDGYCWICHQVGHDLSCSSCPRVYHSSCVKKKHLPFNASGSCGECQAQFLSKGNATPIMHKHSLSELLELVMQEALKEDVKKNNQKSQHRSNESKFWKYFETWPEISNLCQIIDLSILIDKLKKKHYLTTAEFFSDVKWIYHNCYILHKVDSDITETALKLEKNFKKELLDLEACSECYFNKHSKDSHQSNFFTMVCEEPHDIVWAKLRGSPYWPAKCMKIYNGHVDVSFFGTHDKSSIQLSQCYRISQKSPNDKEIKQSKYLDAITELSIYVSNYRVIYNSFPYYPYRTPLVDSKASTLKKSNKKGRHRRSPSDKQLDDSYNSDISESSEFTKTINEKGTASDEPVKSIKGVPIDDPVISIKGLFSHLVSDYESINSIRGVQANSSADSSLYSNHCETDSAELSSKRNNPSEQVAVCMTFTTDDETGPYNQVNAPSKLINMSPAESSVPVGYSTPITSCSPIMIESPNFLHSADELAKSKLNSCSETTLQNDTPHFVNSGSSNMLPMITSVSAEAALNSTFTPEEPVSYPNESVIPETSEIIHNYPNLFSEQGKEFSGNSVLIEDDDDDDDIIVLKQDPPKENKAVNKILNNSKMAHALSQILSSNKPHLQHLYTEFLDFGVKSFLKVWLSSTLKKHDENEILAFYQLYDQLHQKYDELSKENESLKQVAETLKQENELLNGKVAEMRVEVEKANLRINNAGRVVSLMSMNSNKSKQPEVHQLEKLQSQHISDLKEIQALKEKLHEFENNLLERDNMENHQLAKLQSQRDLDLKKIEILEEKLRNFENNLLEKDNEVKECKERVLELEDQLKTLLEKASCTTSECQTSLSDLPDNEMYTLKELEEFKKTCEEESNYKHTKQPKDDDCSDSEYEVTRRTVTKRTTSLIEVDENGMVINPGTPHIFGNTSFSMEYAMGPPFTVVSSSLPSAVILNPEYVSQQSSITSSSSTPRRNRSKKKNSHHNRN